MRTVYKVLAYAIAVEVVVQAMMMVWAIAGLGTWVDGGGVFDKSVMESEQMPFTEIIGIIVHGLNGGMLIPIIALLLVIASLFAKVPGGVKFALIVLGLVLVQVTLGYSGHALPFLGMLHGGNALLLFAMALHTARRVSRVSETPPAGSAHGQVAAGA